MTAVHPLARRNVLADRTAQGRGWSWGLDSEAFPPGAHSALLHDDRRAASPSVVLASSDPRSVLGVIRLSKASNLKDGPELVWGVGYNLLAIPLAAGVFASLASPCRPRWERSL